MVDMVKDIISLMRVRQWYKNFIVFLPIVFLVRFFDIHALIQVVFAFFALCFVSSANYIINDVVDCKRDRLSSEKRNRPIADERISIDFALLISLILLLIGLLVSLRIGVFIYVFGLFVLGQLYSFWLKNEAFVDVLLVSVGFVIRAIAGSVVLNAFISPWLVLCTFFLALFLIVGKRESEIKFLGAESSRLHRRVLRFYTKEITNSLMIVATSSLIISYALYSFLSNFNLLWTIPFTFYVIFRYVYLIYSGSVIARHPEKVVKDYRMVIGILLWVGSVFFLIYY